MYNSIYIIFIYKYNIYINVIYYDIYKKDLFDYILKN